MRIGLMCAMALGLAVVAAPGTAKAEDDKEEAEAKPAKEKKICRSEPITGSLTRVNRICMTETEWKSINDRTRKEVDKLQSGAAGGTAVANNQGSDG